MVIASDAPSAACARVLTPLRRDSGPERAALELAEAVLTPNPFGDRVSDDLFARLSRHYDTDEIWHLTMALGYFSLFTPVALVGKPVPGRPPGKNYTS
ncbi:hypothetical protein [Streptomyces tendae]|uniref:hypothetical protein n=1 Tax=Streptomyces tendae TaxID=1932 RepID=UPI00249068AB|nr:hypothetical protein [Streptomyces tendae]